jgi:protein-disulfide isomerase
MATKMQALKKVLDMGSSVGVIVACVVLVFSRFGGNPSGSVGSKQPPLPKDPISIAASATSGSLAARVALVEFSDFQCPFCARFALDTLPILRTEYVDTGKVVIAFRHLPLPNHQLASKAAEAAECAWRQKKFWEMHDWLFANLSDVDGESLVTRASTVPGLDSERFAACVAGEAAQDVEEDRATAIGLKLSSTPVFMIGALTSGEMVRVTHVIKGAQPIAEFRRVLDLAVAETTAR